MIDSYSTNDRGANNWWYVGRMKEVPGVFSQGKNLDELEENIRDAYRVMMSDEDLAAPESAQIKDVDVEV